VPPAQKESVTVRVEFESGPLAGDLKADRELKVQR
jgi:hypothetical protein